MESPHADKKNNYKKVNNSSSVGNGNTKVPNFMITSRSPSPEHSSLINPKPNQVSNVILYGIPIVSLYIESQERLCLAQISNTLLKQFSYNEIHNRRVALGITCVQCTPVQLEILRRAGAMPVSSRRCGMITRREAERLCKSFLGDNSPPRLPDDFSFAVFHECAWGCRGNFLPSRYNSSRAKCIKCAYCGLFFSPNKFIFHSHRLPPNDRYIQPDAANFNSWRRHLRLSGSPSEKITHAWEDVKAMFNGGTRKRLMSSSSISSPSRPNCKADSTSIPSSATPQPPAKRAKDNASNSPSSTTPQFAPTRPLHHHHSSIPTNANNSNHITAAGAAAGSGGVVGNGGGGGVNSVVPLNTPIRASSSTFSQELPFSLSRSFMIDYMWQQTHSTSMNAAVSSSANKVNHFQFPPYSALNWIKQQPTSSFLFKPNSSSTTIAPTQPLPLNPSSDEKPPAFNHFHSAAFKPVINAMRLSEDTANAVSSVATLNVRNQSPTSSTSSNYNHTTASSTNQSDDEQLASAGKKFINRKRLLVEKDDVDFYNDNNNEEERKVYVTNGNGGDTNARSQTISDDDDENEMVDIETTEDDIQIHNLQPYRSSNYGTEDEEEEIEVTDGGKLENNNHLASPYDDQYGVRVKSPIKFLKEIVNRSEREIEESYLQKKNSNCTLNLKKEPGRHESPSTFNYVHKIHTAASKSTSDGTPPPPPPTKLWSVARLSLECNNNNNNNGSNFDERTSFYQHLSQMQHKNFHHIDTASASNASSI